MNSVIVAIVLAAVLTIFLCNALRSHQYDYDALPSSDRSEEEGHQRANETTGRDLYLDMFSVQASGPPGWLEVCFGAGVQLLATTILMVILLPPETKPPFDYYLLAFLYSLMGLFNGYATATLYKVFGKKDWRQVAVRAGSSSMGMFLILCIAAFSTDAEVWRYRYPIERGLFFLILLLAITRPWDPWGAYLVIFMLIMTSLGGYLGFQHTIINFPVLRTALPTRPIHFQPLHLRLPISLIVSGILPFRAFILLFRPVPYSTRSISFQLAVTFLVSLTSAKVTAFMTYAQLCRGNYRWWWPSFCNGGAMALYALWYSIAFVSNSHLATWSSVYLYYVTIAMDCFCMFLMRGSVGLASSL